MKAKEELLRNPKPGTAAARARDFGIDLTLVIERLRQTPEERIRLLDNMRDSLKRIKANARMVTRDERY